MSRRPARNLTLAALFACGVSASAYAAPITFSFDTQGGCTGLSGGSLPTTIQTYMNCVLTATPAVTGATVAAPTGAVVSKGVSNPNAMASYAGEGFVVGAPGSPIVPLTLGNTEGATSSSTTGNSIGGALVAGAADAFLINNSLGTGAAAADQFGLTFGNGFTIAAGSTIKFDYEIFPDGTCPAYTAASCGGTMVGGHYPNQPDFKFSINGVQVAGSPIYSVPAGAAGGTYAGSPVNAAETAPQRLGTFTYTVVSTLVNPTLTFMDWPATIGVDNLAFSNVTKTSVPEPMTLALVGLGMVGLRTYRRRKAA